MQSQTSTPLVSDDNLFIERRNVYGSGTVVLTATISDGVALLEQHPERLTISRELHAIIPLITVEGIERLEAFLARAKEQLRAREKGQQRRVRRRCC
jgi:hypothetical protein